MNRVLESTGVQRMQPATVLIDIALNDYEVVWSAAGHPHAVFSTTFEKVDEATTAQ